MIRSYKGLAAVLFLSAVCLYGCGSTPVDDTTDGKNVVFTLYYDTSGLAGSSINDLAVDYSRNGLWIATWNGISFYSFTDSTFTTYGVTSDITDIKVNSLAVNSGSVWAGTVFGISTFTQNTWITPADQSVLPDPYINTVVSLTDNSLWFGTRGGVSRKTADGLWTSFSMSNGLSDNNVTSVAKDADGKIWVGTNNGVDVYDGTQWYSMAAGLPGIAVRALYRDSSGTMWVGTDKGVVSFQGNSGTIWDISKGLPSNTINDFMEDYSHILWAATDNGVAYFNGTNWSKFTLPDAVNGLPVSTVASDSKTLSIWFGTNLGLVRYQVK